MNLENLLLKAINKESYKKEFDFVSNLYKLDLDVYQLETQLMTLAVSFPNSDTNVKISDIKKFMKQPGKRELLSEIHEVLKLILVIPATNASSERSFSALKRVKTYMRTTMSQDRLNNLMMLYVHKEKTDNLCLIDVCNEYVSRSESRLSKFGKFVK